MHNASKGSKGLIVLAMLALPVSGSLAAQDQNIAGDEVMTTVYGTPPADLSGLAAGPEIEGIITARTGEAMQVTTSDGSNTVVSISEGTQIRAKKGLFGLGRDVLNADALLNGLPVTVETVRWGGGLVASQIRFKNDDFQTAAMIRNGTSQRFAEQGAAIEQNAAATEALRGRVGDIDKYNIKGTTNVYYDTGKWKLSPQAETELCAAAAQADAMDNALLLVVGYTDSVGSQEYNQVLSERRAGRVVNFLQQECRWKPWRMLTPTGMAEADPLADNNTAAGKAQNRRVSVNILVSKGLDGM
ncbi:OmpA family protein [Altererythrobacter aquiaggeris]|uniref:OmpA family protein n=1 Tax=Aestuarierythrobacter aquiaggeris TaxID=1898396 RepID=UPI003018A760